MALKNEKRLNLVLVERKDEYIYQELIDFYKRELKSNINSTNYLSINPSETEFATILRFINNRMYGNIKKLLILQCFDLKVLERKTGNNKSSKNLFQEILNCLQSNKDIKVVISVETINKKSKLYSKLELCSEIIPFKPMLKKQYIAFAKNECKKYNLNIEYNDIKYLISLLDNSCSRIHLEIYKLYLMGFNKITKQILNDVIFKSRRYIVFELINAIADRKINLSYKILGELLNNGTNALQIIALLQKHIIMLFYCKNKCDFSDMNKYSFNNYMEQSLLFETDKLIFILEKTCYYEWLIKSWLVNDKENEFLLRTFIFEII